MTDEFDFIMDMHGDKLAGRGMPASRKASKSPSAAGGPMLHQQSGNVLWERRPLGTTRSLGNKPSVRFGHCSDPNKVEPDTAANLLIIVAPRISPLATKAYFFESLPSRPAHFGNDVGHDRIASGAHAQSPCVTLDRSALLNPDMTGHDRV